MQLNQYLAWTDSVAQYPVTAESFYLALGLSDEYGEFMDVVYNGEPEKQEAVLAIVKEAGDVLWYLGRYGRNVLKMDVEATTLRLADEARKNPYSADANYQIQKGAEMVIHIGALCGFEKKKLRDGDTWSVEKKIEKKLAADRSWENIMIGLLHALQFFEVELQSVMDANVEKLSKRREDDTIKGDGSDR